MGLATAKKAEELVSCMISACDLEADGEINMKDVHSCVDSIVPFNIGLA